MFSPASFPMDASSLFAAYASFTAIMMLIRTAANELIPGPVRSYLESLLNRLFFKPLLNPEIIVDEFCGIGRNEVFDAAEIYLRTKINPNTDRFKVGKTPKQKNLSVTLEKGEEIADNFGDLKLKWRFVVESPNDHSPEKRFFEITFPRNSKDTVMDEYLPFVLARSKEMKDEDKTVKLFTTDGPYDEEDGGGVWGSVHLDHPSTFETLALEPAAKKAIIDDLDRFLRRRDYYKKVGKAWKRGYLLYGPPGTGKSSMIAAMANYLKFDVYDLELTSLYSNSELRRILLSTTNKSIIVIEDIDCSAEMHDRNDGYRDRQKRSNTKLTLSGLLNFIDGLWSSCGDERIIVFTTNHKDRLDPALLRPGRMDMHIHMSYCTYSGFKLLASNYLGLHDGDDHETFDEIKTLIEEVEVTPAQIAEELMKSEDAEVALGGVVDFLKMKKKEASEVVVKEVKGDDVSMQEERVVEMDVGKREARGVRRRGGRRGRGKIEDLIL